MELRLIRTHLMGDACCGTLMIRNEHGSWEKYCATLEDLPRDKKVMHTTCIPEGTYEIKKRKVVSHMTERYRSIYGKMFDFHLELKDVPNYTYVYIHHGNKATDTSGCILVGTKVIRSKGNGFILSSRSTFRHLYPMISKALKDGEKVTIEIVNEFTANA
ncbi:DUF5675 family protein (plasmid) [Halobacteriovorax sp. GFR7]|uniref:DUF5675 family protein n=1 Tax=unclassified Halobacteriovorax TaxID=2639665 RepID=UPI003D96DD36